MARSWTDRECRNLNLLDAVAVAVILPELGAQGVNARWNDGHCHADCVPEP